MAKASNDTTTLSYDEAMARVEHIVQQLENAEALSMEEYKRLASEAANLLAYCKKELEKEKTLFASAES